MSDPILVGTITLPEPRSHRYDISETASRYEAVLLEAGTYEVFATRHHLYDHEVRFHAMIPGVVTSRYDGAEFCGVAIGSSPQHDRHPDVGQTRDVRFPLFPGDITLNETALELLAWKWRTSVWGADSSGRLRCHTYKSVIWQDALRKVEWKLIVEGALPEFFSDAYTLVTRTNELLDAGITPEVTHRYCTDEPVSESRWYPEHALARL